MTKDVTGLMDYVPFPTKVAIWTVLVSLAVSAGIAAWAVEGTIAGQYLTADKFTGLVLRLNLSSHIPSTFEKIIAAGGSDKEQFQGLAVVAIPGVILVLGTVVFHWRARRRFGRQFSLASYAISYFLSYVAVYTACTLAAAGLLIQDWGKIGQALQKVGSTSGVTQAIWYTAGVVGFTSVLLAVFRFSRETRIYTEEGRHEER